MEEPTPQTTCKVCKEEILKGAKKCNHCNSFQDYRRYINFSTTILSLLVALSTVLSFGVPYFLEAIEEPSSDVKAHLIAQNFRTNEIDIYCANEGKRPGLIHGATIEFEFDNKNYYITLRRKFAKVDNVDILKKEDKRERDLYELYPFKTVLLRYESITGFPINKDNFQDKFSSEFDKSEIKNISLKLATTDFKGKPTRKIVVSEEQSIDSLLFEYLRKLPILIK